MGSTLNPYINFKDYAREALEFYRDALGGELHVNTFGEFGDDSTRPRPTWSCTGSWRPPPASP